MIMLMSWSCPPAHKFLNNGVTLPLVKGNPFLTLVFACDASLSIILCAIEVCRDITTLTGYITSTYFIEQLKTTLRS